MTDNLQVNINFDTSALENALRSATQAMNLLSIRLNPIKEYSKIGYTYGKSIRGLKKWIKKQHAKLKN
jgi:hypothetical protein